MFYLVVILLGAGDLFFWWWADRRLQQLRSPRTWCVLLGALMGLQFLTLAWWVIFPSSMRGLGGGFWKPVSAWLYMWHLLVLPLTLLALLLGYTILGAGRLALRFLTTEDPTPHARLRAEADDPDSSTSRTTTPPHTRRRLPPPLSARRHLASVAPLATCVVNHDRFEDGAAFRKQLLLADVGLLCDEVMPLTIRGERLDLLGLDWGAPKQPRVHNLE